MSDENKVCFLCGAGAEVGLGMPLGYEMAIEALFETHLVNNTKQKIKEELEQLKSKIYYYDDWFKINEIKPNAIKSLTSIDEASIFKDVINVSYTSIIESINTLCELDGDITSDLSKIIHENQEYHLPLKYLYEAATIEHRKRECGKYLDNSYPAKIKFDSDIVTKIKNMLFDKNMSALSSQLVSYKNFVDKYYQYLFIPSDSYAKFFKIYIFLRAVSKYMSDMEYPEKPDQEINEHTECYYRDIKNFYDEFQGCVSSTVEKTVFTTNYTRFCKEFLPSRAEYLNGRLDYMYDPYLRKCIPKDTEELNFKIKVPYIYVQSGLKPILSKEMVQCYYDFKKALDESNKLVVVGYNFNEDDGHINSLIREFLELNKKNKLIVFIHCNSFDKDKICQSIRWFNTNNIETFPIDDERKYNGQLWTDLIKE